jgi:6-phosphogluconolactonase (cycloisomerase 2 family)
LTQDGIAGYNIDPSSHQLTVMPGEPFTTGDGPVCLVIDPSSQFIYEANFNDSTVTGQFIDQNTGVLEVFSQTTHAPSSYTLNGPATWCLVDGRTS